jgi:hypothetical protein
LFLSLQTIKLLHGKYETELTLFIISCLLSSLSKTEFLADFYFVLATLRVSKLIKIIKRVHKIPWGLKNRMIMCNSFLGLPFKRPFMVSNKFFRISLSTCTRNWVSYLTFLVLPSRFCICIIYVLLVLLVEKNNEQQFNKLLKDYFYWVILKDIFF